MRDWSYNSDHLYWNGEVFNDTAEVFRDGQPIRFSSREVLEVIDYKRFQILQMKSGDRWYMYFENELKVGGS